MGVAEELLNTLQSALGRRPLPRVRALHLPGEAARGSKDGEFGALELDDGSIGLSYVLLDDTLAALQRDTPGALLRGTDPLELAWDWLRADGARRTVGFAAVNALTRHLFDRAGFRPPDAADSVGGLDPQPGDHVGMVGLFPPLVKQVTRSGARLTVIELRADLAGRHEGFEVTLEPAALADCNKVLCTSTVLLNDTLDAILAHAAHAQAFAMIGPGAGCLPDPLFARGVTLMGGSWITDGEAFEQALLQGRPWGAHASKFALARAGYPGAAALAAAASHRGRARNAP